MVEGPLDPHTPDARLTHPEVRYERTDVSLRGVLIVLGVTACCGALVFWIVWAFFQHTNAREAALKRSLFPLAAAPADRLPAEPRLEQVDRLRRIERPDVYQREAAKEAILNGTGPTSEAGFVHIPIERAMKLVVKQLPVRSEPRRGPSRDNGLLDSGEPNSGRVFREGRR